MKISVTLRGSTLVEALVAMVILAISVSTALMIYTNVIEAENGRLKLSAELCLREVSFRTKREKTFLDEDITLERFVVKKTLERYGSVTGIIKLKLVALDNKNRKLAERTELIEENP